MTTLPPRTPAGTPQNTDPNPDRTADTAYVDDRLAQRCTSSAQFLAGVIAAAMLDTVARPSQLATDLFPHIPPEDVTAVWNRALAVGYLAGQLTARPNWTREALTALRGELNAAGHTSMGALTARSANTLPAPRPADHDTDQADAVRGGHE